MHVGGVVGELKFPAGHEPPNFWLCKGGVGKLQGHVKVCAKRAMSRLSLRRGKNRELRVPEGHGVPKEAGEKEGERRGKGVGENRQNSGPTVQTWGERTIEEGT